MSELQVEKVRKMQKFPLEWLTSTFSHEEDDTLGDDRTAVVDFVEKYFEDIFGFPADESESVECQAYEIIGSYDEQELKEALCRARSFY